MLQKWLQHFNIHIIFIQILAPSEFATSKYHRTFCNGVTSAPTKKQSEPASAPVAGILCTVAAVDTAVSYPVGETLMRPQLLWSVMQQERRNRFLFPPILKPLSCMKNKQCTCKNRSKQSAGS